MNNFTKRKDRPLKKPESHPSHTENYTVGDSPVKNE